MKIKLILAFAIVAILVTVTTAGFLVRSYFTNSSGLAADGTPKDDRSAPERVLDDLAAVVGLQTDAQEHGQGARQAALDAAPRVHGRVDTFGACADKGEIIVYGLRRATNLEGLMSELAIELGHKEGEAELVLARASVDADGQFELIPPAGVQRLHILAVGSVAYQLESQVVSLEDGSARVSLLPYCGAQISGSVYRKGTPEQAAHSSPIAGAKVKLTQLRNERAVGVQRLVRYAGTDDDGAFTLPALPLPGSYQVEVDAPDLASMRLDAVDLSPGEARSLEFNLTPGAELQGRVTDPDGRPVVGAEVQAHVEGNVKRSGFGKRKAETDAAGNFTLRALAPMRTKIIASMDGYLESDAMHLDITEGEQHEGLLLVLEPGSALAGQVTWPDGSPGVELPVKVSFDRASQFARFGSLNAARGASGEGRTDSEGRFRITGLGKGPFSVMVSAPPPGGTSQKAPELQDQDSIAADHWRTSIDGVAPGTEDISLVLAAPISLSGIVRTSDGEPLTNFTVRSAQQMETEIGVLARDGRDDSFPVDAASQDKAADGEQPGEFQLFGLGAGRWNFYASAEGYATSKAIPLDLPEQAGTRLEFNMRRSATISGIVLSPRGAPIAGAKVSLDESGPSWRSLASGAPAASQTVSADDGGFELSGLPPGLVFLSAAAEGYASGKTPALEVEPGARLDDVQLKLREGAVLTGEVFNRENMPVPGALIQLVSTPDFDVLLSRTDDHGRFRFEHLEAGTWQVVAMPSGERLQSIASGDGDTASALLGEMELMIVDLADGGSEHVVLGQQPDDPVALSGRVLADGAPVPDVVLRFFKEGTDVQLHKRHATANKSGEFTVLLDGGGRYVVSSTRALHGPMNESHLEFHIEVPEGEAHSITLEFPQASLHGVVTHAAGEPAAYARVTLVPRGPASTRSPYAPHYTQTQADEQGRYTISSVPEGDYVLAAGGMNSGGLFESVSEYGRVLRKVSIEDAQDLAVEPIQLPAAAMARVVVLDPGGRPVEGAAIFARDEQGLLLESVAMLMTDVTGSCKYRGLAPGRYSFTARKGDLASQESELITVGAGLPVELTLELEEATMLWVQLRNHDNQPTPGEVLLYDSAGHELQGMVSLHDFLRSPGGHPFVTNELEFGPLAPGKYRVIAQRGEQRFRRIVVLDGRTERKLTLRFK